MKNRSKAKFRTVPLGSLITEDQAKQIWTILRNNPDSSKRVREVSQYLITLRKQLEKQGALPEYLAYAVEFEYLTKLGAPASQEPE